MYLSYYVIYIKSHECLFGLRKNADVLTAKDTLASSV